MAGRVTDLCKLLEILCSLSSSFRSSQRFVSLASTLVLDEEGKWSSGRVGWRDLQCEPHSVTIRVWWAQPHPQRKRT
jgi:hypothetical protein